MIAPAPLRPPSPATTLVVLLGASEYPCKPAWTNPVLGASAAAVRDYVTSPDGFGLAAAQVLDLFDSDVDQVRQLLAIEQFLATAGYAPRDLILYYIGHGGFENRDYYLGIRSTQDRREDITAIESRKLAKIVREGFRRKRLYVIMDACFAASALGDWQGDEAMAAVRNMEQHLPAQGTAFLAAASKHDVTLAPRAERYTIFTGALLEALRNGIDNGAAGLSMHELYDEIRDLLRQREADDEGRPELHVPSQHDGDVSRLPLFPNIAHARALEARRAQEAVRQEARQEAARQEVARQEAARQEAARAKTRRQEAERHEAARIAGEMVGDVESAPGAASRVAVAAAGAAIEVVPPPDAASAASTVPASKRPGGSGRLTIAAFGGLAPVTVVLMIIALSGKSQPAPPLPEPAAVQLPPSPDPNTGFDLYVTPVGITQWKLDGDSRTDRLPSRIRGISPGPHTVQILPPPGFLLSQLQQVSVESGKAPKVEIALQPIPGITGVFESTPPGATVSLTIDGKRQAVGPSPARAPLDPRNGYQVLFEKPGYRSVNRPIAFSGALEEHIIVELEKVSAQAPPPPSPSPRPAPSEPQPRRTGRDGAGSESAASSEPASDDTGDARAKPQGVLVLGSRPPCDIMIDGSITGLHTPQKEIKLPVGRHRITLANAEFGINETFTVDIKAEAPEKLIKDFSDRLPE